MINSLIEQQHNSCGSEQTEALGRNLSEYLLSQQDFPCVVLLSGELGAGKTVFCQGMAHGLGIREPLQSPSFPILFEYPGSPEFGVPLYHFDLYRLNDSEEFDLIGGEDILFGAGSYGPGLSVIEWPERLGACPGALPQLSCLRVSLRFQKPQVNESLKERKESYGTRDRAINKTTSGEVANPYQSREIRIAWGKLSSHSA